MFKNRFTETFGVAHPIVCGGMTAVGTADLVAAVAEAGALGFIAAHNSPTPEALEAEIGRCREMTAKPFGINLTILPSMREIPYDGYREVIIASGIPIVETAGSNPSAHLPALREAGVKIIHKATTVRHALKAQDLGVDAVSIDAFECAGHLGEDDIGGMVLIPRAARQLSIPVIASGGIGTGAGLVAALALGAEAVNMGTRFVASAEAPVHDSVKRQIALNDERDTVIVFRQFHNSARVARNSVSEGIAEIGSRPGATFADVADLASGERGRREVLGAGDIEGGMWWAGQVQGLIESVETVADIIDGIMAEAARVVEDRLMGQLAGGRVGEVTR
jgi:NADH:quinone reductase (non-electrogenic)